MSKDANWDMGPKADMSPTVMKLLQAFSQFGRTEWHQRSIAGCKPSEIRVLFCIGRNDQPDTSEIKVSEISKSLHVTSPTVTQLLKSLEANGLVERRLDLADRRSVGVSLTEKGKYVRLEARKMFATSFKGLVDYLGENESEQLAELLFKAFSYFDDGENNMMFQSAWKENEEAYD